MAAGVIAATGAGAGGTLASAKGVAGGVIVFAGVRLAVGVAGAVALGVEGLGGGTLIGFDLAGI